MTLFATFFGMFLESSMVDKDLSTEATGFNFRIVGDSQASSRQLANRKDSCKDRIKGSVRYLETSKFQIICFVMLYANTALFRHPLYFAKIFVHFP